jgi:hypothetical protein
MSYLRQLGTSSNPSRGKDFVVSVSNEKYIDEIQAIGSRIAALSAQSDGTMAAPVAEKLGAIAAARLRQKLIAVLGWRATVKDALNSYLPNVLLTGLKAVTDRFRSGASSAAGGQPVTREGMLQRVAAAGASSALLADTQRELSEIERTMESGEFRAFVEKAAPELLREERRAAGDKAA